MFILLSRAAPRRVTTQPLATDARPVVAVGELATTEAPASSAVEVGSSVDGSTLGVSAGTVTPGYAKPLLFVGGNKYPTAVAAASAIGAVAGWLFGGPLWALGGLVGSNLVGRLGAGYICGQADKAGNAGCDQAGAWGTTPPAF